MATTSENGSSLAERLMERSSRASRIGSRKGLFERFGLESPYEGGAVGEATTQAEKFSYLSSKAYFDELRGLSAMRRHLLWRISAARQRIRVGEALRTAVATNAVRAAMMGAFDPSFIDWSTQLDLEEAGIEEAESTSVMAAARRMRAPERRQTAAERALRAEIASASDVLANLESVAHVAAGPQKREIAEETQRIANLPARRQPAAARRITRGLKGTAAIAARATRLDRGTTELGDRPLAVAQARDDFFKPKGLRRVTEDSPIVMTLEQPEVAPEVEAAPAVQTATRRPVTRARAHREVPVATVAREARTQASTGRAGPPTADRAQRRDQPAASSRPTERIARAMRLEEIAPLTDTRRGLAAALRTPVEPGSPAVALERRVAARAEAGLPDEAGRVTSTTGYVREARPMAMALSEEGKVTRTMALADSVPVMAPIAHAAPPAPEASEPTVGATPSASPASTSTRGPSRRTQTHRTPSTRTEASTAFRTPSSSTSVSGTVRTPTGETATSHLWRTPAARRSPAHGSRRTVAGALPPMARAVHRSAEAPASRVALAQAPIKAAQKVDRREVGLSRQLAAAVAREARAASPTAVLADARTGASGAPRSVADGERTLRAAATGSTAPEMRVAIPEAPAASTESDSAQRAVVGTGPSRRSRALPTVRAASRALAQERLGVRGRLLSPSSTAHLDVTEPGQALAHAPVRTGVATQAAARADVPALDRLATAPARERTPFAEPLTTLASREDLPDLPPEPTAPTAVPTRSAAPRRPVRAASVESAPEQRIGPVARASERQVGRERVGTTGSLIAPRVVAPFVDAAPVVQTLAQAARLDVAPVAQRAETRLGETRRAPADASLSAPVARTAEGRAHVGIAPAELTLALPEAAPEAIEEARSGLVSRAAKRATPPASRRSVVPDATPEIAKAHERQAASAVGTSQPVRTESGRVVPSNALRTDVGATERSLAWRTPRSFVARTIATRTPDSETVISEAVRTATGRVERSQAFRTGSRPAVQGSAPLADESFVTPDAAQLAHEVDPEGAVVRASRRVEASRTAVADSALSWLEKRDAPVEAVGQTSRALGRTAVRRDAGSLVPHPVGSAQTDQAATRMLAGPDQVFAAPEGVILDGDVAIPAASVRSQRPIRVRGAEAAPATREIGAIGDTAATATVARAERRLSPMAGVTDGMTLAMPSAPEPTSIAGGVHAVAPRPGAPSRSRLQRALRAATTSASARATESVLTLPAPQRQLEDAAPRQFQARVHLDDEGRVVRGEIEDVVSGATLALPERPSSAAWAEDREARAVPSERRARPSRRAAQDAGGTFVPTLGAVDVDAPVGARPEGTWSALDSTLDSLVSSERPEAAPSFDRRPLVRRRAWQRRSMAAELGVLAPTLADAEFSTIPDVPEDAPAWARRAVKGTSARAPEREAPEGTVAEAAGARPEAKPEAPAYEPSSLMGALARTERPEDLVQLILERGQREAQSLRNELPGEAVQIVDTIVNLGPEESAFLRSGRRIQPAQLGQAMSGTRTSRAQTGAPDLHQLSAGKEGVGANKIMKLADKLMGLIHLAENARGREAREQVRMAEDSNEARAEGGIKVPGMSVEDMEMNIEALQKNVLNSVMEYFEELDSRREDPDGRNKWW
ncbi:MAG: hypothetical protein H6737_08055 [Alphaproteobacteria bacterium]|nr:hypothetical protein [Alphaproteobacteria bacterium]